MQHTMRPRGVCARGLSFELEGDTVHNIKFNGGCNGNLKAISKLCEGMTVERMEELLLGNTCGMNTTSCADQMARLVREAYDQEREQGEA